MLINFWLLLWPLDYKPSTEIPTEISSNKFIILVFVEIKHLDKISLGFNHTLGGTVKDN